MIENGNLASNSRKGIMMHNSLSYMQHQKNTFAFGGVIKMQEEQFQGFISTKEISLIVTSKDDYFFKTTYKYLCNYMGFLIFTETSKPLDILETIEVIVVEKIWLPT